MRNQKLLLALACGLFLLFGFGLYGSTGRDDVYITYWPAHTLAQRGQILNYNGEAVEQSSSLLYVLVLGLVSAISRFEPHQFGLYLSVLFGLGAVGLTYLLGLRVKPERAGIAAVLAATLVPLVYWSYSGMETSLVACLAVLLVLGFDSFLEGKRALALLAIPLWLLIRPEAPFTLLAFAVAALVFVREGWRAVMVLIAYGLLVSVLIAAFRVWHFGTPLPQPAMVKGGAKLSEGLWYLERNWPIVLLALPCVWLLRGGRAARIAACMAGTILCFVVAAGGDWMEGARFLAPLVPFAAAGLVYLQVSRWPLLAIAAANAAWLVEFGVNSSTGTPIWAVRPRPGYDYFVSASRLRSMDVGAVDLVHHAFRDGKIVLYSNQMGLVVYYLSLRHPGGLRVLDRAALVERSFSSCQVTAGYPHAQNGLRVPFGLPLGPTLSSCGIPRPDVVYDIRPEFQREAEQAGYAVLGVLNEAPYPAGIFKGGAPPRHHFVAIRFP